ncbi:PREDICTED: uncharacterized protein LOC102107205 [Pseudopodoces humilis]|uniref:uncharacterized protein LOC102107205 n=1 Tax=Pseudopodoces humilis TaxID=181119 RepID=UPI0006B7E025|nr:PREDICTED: uncharacterized protein LOC102107205 [Pseudopodoces humilis]
MGQSGSVGRGLAMGQRCCGAALTGLCRGAAALLGLPGFPRAHALLLGALVGLGPLLRGRGDPHSVLASPHNRLEARLTSSAAAWTWLLIGSLLVASHPWLRPPWGSALRALARLAVALALSRAGHALGHALEAATGWCRSPAPQGILLLPLDDPGACRGAGHTWEGFGPAPQAFALVHCGLGLAEEAAALGRSLYGGRGKMAAEERGKMAAGYDVREEFKMAPRSKMAAGYEVGEESKMAAGRGWAWPRPIRLEWAEPPHANYGWGRPLTPEGAGPSYYGWGGHLGRPFWGRGGHFEPRGGHFESGHLEPHGGHLEPHGGHFEPHGGHFEPHDGHFEPRGGHFEGGHFESGHFESGHLEPRLSRFDVGHFDRAGGHLAPGQPPRRGRHLARRGGHFEGSGGHFGGEERAPPAALSVLYLLALLLLVTWHFLLVVTLTYRNTWARNAAGAALGWAAWAVTYRGWYRWAWSPGPPGWG